LASEDGVTGTIPYCHGKIPHSRKLLKVVIASQSESFCYTYVGELKMTAPSEEKLICDKFNLEALTVNQVKSFKALRPKVLAPLFNKGTADLNRLPKILPSPCPL
jgi:hypothetical protein